MVSNAQQETTADGKPESSTTAKSGDNAAASADPSAARKRRKAIIESQRKESEEAAQQLKGTENEGFKTNSGKAIAASDAAEEGASRDSDEEASNSNGKKRKTKRTQIRYDPDVPMSKEQLAAWRREARRVRNRESAAASRQRIRNRITELETEVDEYKAKYHAALARLKELEDLASANGTQEVAAADSTQTTV